MNDFSQRIADLSPEKRALFELQLMKKAPHPGKEHSIPRRGSSAPCPLSFTQQRLWFLDQLEPDSPLYNIGRALRITGPLNVEALQKTLDTIVARHEALRTTFDAVDGTPVQVVAQNPRSEMAVIDLSSLPPSEKAEEVRRWAHSEIRRPFKLSSDLMLRTALARLGEEEHVLVLAMHHIASDGWSMGILSREISTLYESFAANKPSPLPELPIQYPDFAVWQRQRLQGEALESQIAYWKKQLASLQVVELPTDRPRPALQTFRGARQNFTLPSGLSEALRALSRREGVTLFMTLLAAFQTLLHRYTGQPDIVVGSPVAGRTRAETEELIGFFVNTLVLRADLSDNPSFRQLLKRVRDGALGAYAHQDIPFEKLVEELQPERDLSRNPLFQHWFALQNVPRQSLELAGSTVTPLETGGAMAKFDLALSIFEAGETLRGMLEYNTDLFDASTITRMVEHFQTLIEGIAVDPEQTLADLPLLGEAERRQLLLEWNDTKKTYPGPQCVHQLFEAQAERTPDAVAALFPSTALPSGLSLRVEDGTGPSTSSVPAENRQLTYRQLNERANRLAHKLQRLGIGPGALVGICVERSLEMVIGLLGILKAGAAYVPLDPNYPLERLAFMLEDSRAPLVLTQQNLLNELFEHKGFRRDNGDPRFEVICLDTADEMTGDRQSPADTANIDNGVTAKSVAYVIFTSGSTGKPKGVEILHGAIVNFLNSMREEPGLTERDTLLSVTTLSFDIAALEIFLPLTVGARVVIVGRETAADGKLLAETLAACGATAMQATPATWRLLLEAEWEGGADFKMLCGGEALPGDLAAQLMDKGSSLWNMYGPTETTIWSTLRRIDSKDRPISVGRPIANTQIYILDSHQKPVPVGVPGDLYVGGAGLARGYLNRPDLTAQSFVRHPFSPVLSNVEGTEPEARLYKTGDVARYRSGGEIEIVGRKDHQVKIRGFRVELGEVEAVLSGHPDVHQAVAAVAEVTPGDKRLVCYIVPKAGAAPTTTELRAFLRTRLPEYMIPSAVTTIESVPLTPSGKIDRRALPALDQSRPELGNPFVPPRTPAEERLTEIWAAVLRVERVGVHDNFFDLGGHSLLAIQLVSRVGKAFALELPVRSIFEHPTIAALAAQIEEEQAKKIAQNGMVGVLSDLEALSEEEAERLLAEEAADKAAN